MAELVRNEHPHIVRREGVCGGEPLIDGLRVTVRHVVTLHPRGETIPQITGTLGITDAQVFHALSYFADHRDEIVGLSRRKSRPMATSSAPEALFVRLYLDRHVIYNTTRRRPANPWI